MNTDQPIAPCPCNDNPALWTIDPAANLQVMQPAPPNNDDAKRALLSDISLFSGVLTALFYFFG